MPSSEELEVLRQRHKEYYEDRQAILEMSDSDIEESMCRIIAAHDRYPSLLPSYKKYPPQIL